MRKLIRILGAILFLVVIAINQLYMNISQFASLINRETFVLLILFILFLFYEYIIREIKRFINLPWNRKYILIGFFLLILIFLLVKNDDNAIWVMVLISILVVTYDVKAIADFITHYVNTIKIGENELQFNQRIAGLVQDVEKIKDDVRIEESIEDISKDLPKDIALDDINEIEGNIYNIDDDIVDVQKKIYNGIIVNPIGSLMYLYSIIESKIRKDVNLFREEGNNDRNIHSNVKYGVKKGIFPNNFLEIIREFWSIRNKIIHGDYSNIDNKEIISMINLGLDILNILSRPKQTFNKSYLLILEYLNTHNVIDKKDIYSTLGSFTYANHIKLMFEPWDLISHNTERQITINERGRMFLEGEISIPESIVRLYTDQWVPAPGSRYITVHDISDKNE